MVSAYLTDTVTRHITGGLDEYNELQPDTSEDLAAQVVWKTRIVRGANGEEVTAAGHIVTRTALAYGDRVTIAGRAHNVLSVEEIRVFSRIQGYRTYFA